MGVEICGGHTGAKPKKRPRAHIIVVIFVRMSYTARNLFQIFMPDCSMNEYSFNSFFAGIGGFDLAFERSGYSPRFHCEIDSFCQKVLATHWPTVKLAKDITDVSKDNIPIADVWCGGFPCQDVSVARGSKGREGLQGKNSGLFFPFARLIEKHKPQVLLIENVTGLLSAHNGQDFRIVLETLSGMGYAVAWRVMNARYFGAPQSRPRVFICAFLGQPERALFSLYEVNGGLDPKDKRKGFMIPSKGKRGRARVPKVAFCLAATSGRHTGTDWSRTYVSYESQVRRLTPSECEGIQGFPAGWTDVGPISESRDQDVDSPRYKALGNAVAVPVVKWIAKRIKTALGMSPIQAVYGKEQLRQAVDLYQDFADPSLREMKLSDLHLSIVSNGDKLKWQTGGLISGDYCWDIKAPEAPSRPIQRELISVIEKTRPSEQYFLTPNAAIGILRRVKSQKRTLFGPMSRALEKMSRQG